MAEKIKNNNVLKNSHIKDGVDYLALRNHYEKTSNQQQLDYIIKKYLESCRYSYVYSVSPVLKGVTLSEEAINSLSVEEVITLLLNDAKPTASLKSILFDKDRTDCYDLKFFDFLYKHGKLTIGEFENIVLSSKEGIRDINRGIENILEILESDTLKDYEGIDLERIELMLLEFLKNRSFDSITESFERIIPATVKLLTILSYNPKHDELVERLLRYKKQSQYLRYGEYSTYGKIVSKCIVDAVNTYLFRDDTKILGLLDFMITRPDLIRLSKDTNANLSGDEKGIVLNSIISGKCKHTAFAMYLFPELWYNRSDIINSWTKNDMGLELDIYLTRLLSDENFSLEEALELDTQYTAAMEPEDKKKDI